MSKKHEKHEEYPTFMRLRPPKRHWTKYFLDVDEGKILRRTPSSWAKIILFFIVFYLALAALFTICLHTLYLTLSVEYPKWKLDESLIGTNPGLGFRPISPHTEQGSLIWYKQKSPEATNFWISLINDFLGPYQNTSLLPGGGQNQIHCDFNTTLTAGKVCAVQLTEFGDCVPEKGYGYPQAAPCIFLKLNRIYGWEPDYYNDVENLPSDMPLDLKAYIKSIPEHERNQVWISCRGENPADNETVNSIKYFPRQGIPSYYFPYTNAIGYLSPLVAVKLERPELHILINVECRAWAKNIIYNGGRDRQGSVHFEVMIDLK